MKSRFEEFLDSRCGMQDAGCQMRDDGWQMTDDGYQMTDDGYQMTDDGYQISDIRYQLSDTEIPDDEKIWKGISGELERGRTFRIRLLSAAAVMLLLISSGVAVSLIMKYRQVPGMDYSLQNVSKQLGAEENFFRLTVLQKMDEVKKSGANSDDYYEMMQQLEQIDRQYKTYMSDLKEMGNQPKILRGIIRCYELKIRVIENTLNEIAKNKKNENEKHIL